MFCVSRVAGETYHVCFVCLVLLVRRIMCVLCVCVCVCVYSMSQVPNGVALSTRKGILPKSLVNLWLPMLRRLTRS